ncbi:hypothetical protein ATI61_102603 [Archangium gephyra]|uniref:Acetoacetate decarboxylase n=1 Tax=Archangium gephyra TaxID=48 RepID=A0AAC8QD56_9BACT|nr:hypothetical protein [Archangium gephyra]AKJ05542.1 Hypothetical protein AA314_07168 [Archangium gephyra]REG36226.1 hypothetical protein ATI61_102603 [Archangium gephyra]
MSETSLAAPQLVINSRMLYSSWIPADPQAAAALLPKGLQPATNRAIYMNQYVVDSEEQTSSFGAYSLTYLGLDLAGRTAPDGVTPSRFFTHYFNSSEKVRAYVRERGVPASPGTTTLELNGGELVATTRVDGTPIIRTVARVGSKISSVARGHLTYVTQVGGKLVAGNYPYVGELASPFELVSLEFLAKDHPVYALRPSSPLQKVEGWCWYAPRDSFVYPGGEYEYKQ